MEHAEDGTPICPQGYRDGTPICPQGYRFESEKVTMQWIQEVPKITIHYRNRHCEGCPLHHRYITSQKGRSARISPQLERMQRRINDYLEVN